MSGTSLNKAFGEAGHSTLSSQSSCPRSTRTALPASLHGRELLENLVPDGAHHVSLLPGVDIRRGLLEPVSQVLALVPRYVSLECTIRHEDPEGVPRKFSHILGWRALLPQSVFEPPQGPVWGSWAGDETRPVLVDRGDQVVHLAKLLRGPESLPPPLQGDPPSGPREGEQWGDERDRVPFDGHCRRGLRLPG